MNAWKDGLPIYLQIKNRVVADIIEGALAEGALLPSIRQVALADQVNPLTVARAYQELADEGYLDKQRGVGMSVAAGAMQRLLLRERQRFMKKEWPAVEARMRLLGFDPLGPPVPSRQGP